MRRSLLKYLACPRCDGDLDGVYDVVQDHEVISGHLRCANCETDFPIVRGVARMNWAMEGLDRVARSFSYEWKSHHRGELEDETLFGRTLDEDWDYFLQGTGQNDADIRGKVVLDGGCGSGRLTRQIGEHQATAVIGVDMNEAVDEAFAASRDLPNVHIVQGNIFALPFKRSVFDIVWSNGVIHHTPDPAKAHAALTRVVTLGGRLYVWVYPKRFNPFRFVKDVLDAMRVTRLPEPALLTISKMLSYPSLLMLKLYRGLRTLPGLRPRTARAFRSVRPRRLREIQLTWFDALSPEYNSRHTENEVVGWFQREGFHSIVALEEPKVGVRGIAGNTAFDSAQRHE